MAAMPDVGAPTERPIKRPKTVEEGMADPGRKEALMREFMAHVKQDTFEIVDREVDMVLLRMLILQTEKLTASGKINKLKARMCINGSDQNQKFGETDSFAPNITPESCLRMLCTYMVCAWRATMCVLRS